MSQFVPFESMFALPIRNGVSYPSRLRGTGTQMVNMREIFAHDRIDNDECERAPLTDKELETYSLAPLDLLFARQSLTFEGAGKCSIFLGADEARTWESHLIRVRLDQSEASPHYYYYYYRSPAGRRSMETIVQQVAAAGVRGSDLARLMVPKPSLSDQNAIAEVLRALDDKIAANANLATKIDHLLTAQFARTTATSGLQTLSAVADVNVESIRPQGNGELRYLDIAAIGVGSYEFPAPITWSDAPGRARRRLRHGDTVWSTVRPNRRSHALVLDHDADLVASTGLAVLTPKHGRFAFVYECTRTPAFTAYLESAAEGSAYPAVRGERFLGAPVPDVGDDSQRQFEQMAAPLRERAHSANVESRTLAEARDALLPRLMSGKIRVRDAERVLEGVV